VVTCSLTSTADSHARKTLRRLRRENGGAVIVACGCYAQSVQGEDPGSFGADILVGNGLKHTIPDALERFLARGDIAEGETGACRSGWDGLSLDRPRLHTRAFVKIQDGCNMRCSYCAVPGLRGPEASRDPSEIAREISDIVESGCGEVILTGIHLGSYRHGDVELADLVGRISATPGLSRLRFGSLEPFAVSERLLRALSESGVFCPHLHLPLESGDDGVLKGMRRGYDSSGFARKLDGVRAHLGDDVHISTDVMAGFPGEDDAAFRNSVRFLERHSFGRVHVFPFSPREGTPAAAMPGQVPRAVARERVRALKEVSSRLLSSYAGGFAGRASRVVLERPDGDVASGWNRHYIRVFSRSAACGPEWAEVSLYPDFEAGGALYCAGVRPEDAAALHDEF
jgi:threonylcarbamoyladenosine tRNA methylthiotransferase MtaB